MSHSQRLNNGKSLGTGHCEWTIAPCPNKPLPYLFRSKLALFQQDYHITFVKKILQDF